MNNLILTEYLFLAEAKLPPTKSQIFVVVMYAILLVIWLIIAWEVGSSVPRFHSLLGMGQTRRRLLTCGLFISLSLAWDAGYWLIATAARNGVLTWPPEEPFYIPINNGLEKVPLILSAIAFLWTFKLIRTLTASEIDRRYFARFAERTLDAIIVLDSQACIRYWNRRAEIMFGWDRDQVRDRCITEFMIPDDRQQETKELLEKVQTSKEAFALERTERLTGTRNRIAVSIDTAPILDPDFQGYFSIIRPAIQRNPFIDHYFRENGLPERKPNKVFVAMPYSTSAGGLDVWSQLLEPIASDLKLELVRADKQMTAHGVVDQEFYDIASSSLVVADLTGNNPNVCYEVGIAHALGIETLLLRTNENISDKLPFNVRHLQIMYCDPNSLSKAQESVRRAIVSRRGY